MLILLIDEMWYKYPNGMRDLCVYSFKNCVKMVVEW